MLLLSLFILSTILLSATAISSVTVRALRAGALADSGHAAYYAAETGIEQALYGVRRQDADPSTLSGGATLATGPSFARQVTVGEPVLYVPSLKKDDFAEVNLFDPADLSRSSGIEALSFDWTDGCGGASSLELSYAEWPLGSLTPPSDPGSFAGTYWKFRHTHAAGVPWLKADTISANENYRMQVKALDCDVTDLSIRGFADDAGAVPRDLPSRVTVASTGSFGGASQTLTVSMERAAPLSGIFGYVIFSEADIVK